MAKGPPDWRKRENARRNDRAAERTRAFVLRSGRPTERDPPPRDNILDSRGQPISLPRVSILEKRKAS